MTHFLFLVAFSVAVGIVLAAMLRRGQERVVRLALWIAGGLILSGLFLGWVLYLLPL